MLSKVQELIFGFETYEKAKIDERFIEASHYLSSLEIRNLEDFEILEKIIYKIKEELRVKSSNINKTIKNPSRKLKKKDVLSMLEQLQEVKFSFLKEAFSLLKEKSPHQAQNSTSSQTSNSVSKKEHIPKKDILKKEGAQVRNDSQALTREDNQIIDLGHVQIKTHFTPIFYLECKFKSKVDFPLISKLSSLVFDLTQAHGTTLLWQESTVSIIPRYQGDSLLDLTPLEDFQDLEEVTSLLTQKTTNSPEDKKIVASKKPQDFQKKQDYLELKASKNTISKEKESLKSKEESLDALLNKVIEKQESTKPAQHISHQTPQNKNLIFEKSDEVKIQKDKTAPSSQKKDQTHSSSKYDIKIISSQKKEKQNPLPSPSSQEGSKIVYQDEQLVVTLKQDSKARYQLELSSPQKKPISQLSNADLSYLLLFSKVFSQVLFDVTKAQGTSIIYSSSSSSISIISRYEKDSLDFGMKPQQDSSDFLTQIQQKLLSTLSGAVEATTSSKQQKHSSEDDEKKEKAKKVLQALRRIP